MDWKGQFQIFIARTHLLERLPLVLTLMLTIALAYRLAVLTWAVMPNVDLDETVPVEAPVSVAQIKKSIVEATISQWNLFGKVEIAPPPTINAPEEVPETRLNLTLLGVLASKTKGTAKAIISDPSGNEEYYSVGSQVPGGATLDEIHNDYVILKRNGRPEILRLPQDEAMVGSNMGGMPPPAMNNSASRAVPPGPGASSDTRSTGAMLKEYRDALNHDPQSVMDLVRAEPVRQGDKLLGYRINPGRDRQLLTRFGLRPGDVVTSVNGIKLDNPIKGLEIIQNLQASSQMSLEVTRNGVAQTYSFNVE